MKMRLVAMPKTSGQPAIAKPGEVLVIQQPFYIEVASGSRVENFFFTGPHDMPLSQFVDQMQRREWLMSNQEGQLVGALENLSDPKSVAEAIGKLMQQGVLPMEEADHVMTVLNALAQEQKAKEGDEKDSGVHEGEHVEADDSESGSRPLQMGEEPRVARDDPADSGHGDRQDDEQAGLDENSHDDGKQ